MNCFLCQSGRDAGDLLWYDRPLWLDSGAGLVVAALGGYTPGYVLVAPIGHHVSLRVAAAIEGDTFIDFVVNVSKYLENCFGPLTFWEHAGREDPTVRRSACVDHAHLHLTPGNLKLPAPPRPVEYPALRHALKKNDGEISEGYLLLGWSGGNVLVGSDLKSSQYYRRQWAHLLGRPDEYDYLVCEDPEITRATIDIFLKSRSA